MHKYTVLLLLFAAAAADCGTTYNITAPLADLPFKYANKQGPFEMKWGFNGDVITIEYTLPSDVYIGLGLGCTDSKACDMVIGNGGGRNPVFLDDYFESHGDQIADRDEDVGGRNDLTLLQASYKNWASTIRFSRKLVTGDHYDAPLKKGITPLVYAWCASFCDGVEEPHAPGDWGIIEVDLSGKGHEIASPPAPMLRASAVADCTPGSDDLCGCSQLVKRGAVSNFDDCSLTAAVEYCEAHGRC